MNQKLISICIPTYNRPLELKRMLESIDTTKYDDVDIVISENCSAQQKETRDVVEAFSAKTSFEVHYYENEQNIGYDRNIRAIMQRSSGKFTMLFSDDDVFIPGAMDEFVEFVRAHQDVGYILRSYKFTFRNGNSMIQRYYPTDRVFPAGRDTYIELYDKGVFLSGFTIRTDYAREYVVDCFDGSLLYQIYLAAEVCYHYTAAYSRIVISEQIPGGVHYFGDSKEEKKLYTGGLKGSKDRLNFASWYMKIIDYMEEKYQDGSAPILKRYMSKYSFSFVAQARGNYWNFREFIDYCKGLKKLGYASSPYFYFYYLTLLVLGGTLSWRIIRYLKNIIGHRPKL